MAYYFIFPHFPNHRSASGATRYLSVHKLGTLRLPPRNRRLRWKLPTNCLGSDTQNFVIRRKFSQNLDVSHIHLGPERSGRTRDTLLEPI